MATQVLAFNYTDSTSAVLEFKKLLGDENVVDEAYEPSTLGVTRYVAGILSPKSRDEVLRIVEIANENELKLHPVSRGKNLGYGDRLPVGEGHWIVDCSRMIGITGYDPVMGSVWVEPGVTQGQLHKFLAWQGRGKFWPDSTGAGTEASIVGNFAEGGFGHTPKGNRRKTVREVEVVLGDGTLLKTGTIPGVGPDLSGLFVQSNFGIITAICIELMPAPEHFESFILQIRDMAHLGKAVDIFRKLRQQDTVTSVVHLGNATRSFISSQEIPEKFARRPLEEKDAQELLSSRFLKFGAWCASGALYGSKIEVEAKKKVLRKKLASVGKVKFFSNKKLQKLSRLLDLLGLRKEKQRLESYKEIHNLLAGTPTDMPLRYIQGRVKDRKNLGLIWVGPTIRAEASDVKFLVDICKGVCKEFGFDCPLTLSFVEPSTLIGILNFTWDKSVKSETERAHRAYKTLNQRFQNAGIKVYRTGVLGMSQTHFEPEKEEFLRGMKGFIDPHTVVSEGKWIR